MDVREGLGERGDWERGGGEREARGDREREGRGGSGCLGEGEGGMGSLLDIDLGQVLLQTVEEEMGRMKEERERRRASKGGS